MKGPKDDLLADRLGYFLISSHVMAKKKRSFCIHAVLGIVANFISARPKFPKLFGSDRKLNQNAHSNKFVLNFGPICPKLVISVQNHWFWPNQTEIVLFG